MAYTKNTNFTAKDALATGNPSKIIKGSELDTEFDEIATESAKAVELAANNTISGDNTLSGTNTFSGAVTASSTVDLSGAVLQGASPLVMEGATANDFETTIAVTDPTADRTITLPDESGTVVTTGTAATTGMGFVIDEDTMASDSATKVPTQQSVKAYVDASDEGVLSASITVDTTNRSTTSTSFVDSSVSITGTLTNSANKFRIRVEGIHGGNTSVGSFTLYRDAVDLTPAGVTSLAGSYLGGTGSAETLSFTLEDSPGDTSSHDYKLYWKTSTGTAYLGRRASDTTIDAPTIMTLEEIKV